MSEVIPDFAETLQELKKNVDPSLIRQREGWRDRNGNVKMVDYVEWHTVADILDETAPNWGHTIKDVRQIGDIMTVTVAVTIDGITREGIGTGGALSDMGIKKAEHDALKRAAVKFGIARDLYKKEFDAHDDEPKGYTNNVRPHPNSPSNPRNAQAPQGFGGDQDNPNIASGLSDLVTNKQLGMIRAMSREAGIDPIKTCQEVMGCNPDELSKKAASNFIDDLLKQGKRA